MFTTYGIFHPETCICVYIGQTGDFEARCKAHRSAHRERKAKEGSIQYWLKQLHTAKLKPNIVALEVVQTERESLASEEKWVEIFTQIGHPLKNGWIEHKDIIQSGKTPKPGQTLPPELVAKEFKDGRKRNIKWGTAKLNKNKTGYRLTLRDKTVLDLLPPSQHDGDLKPVNTYLIDKFKKSIEAE